MAQSIVPMVSTQNPINRRQCVCQLCDLSFQAQGPPVCSPQATKQAFMCAGIAQNRPADLGPGICNTMWDQRCGASACRPPSSRAAAQEGGAHQSSQRQGARCPGNLVGCIACKIMRWLSWQSRVSSSALLPTQVSAQ